MISDQLEGIVDMPEPLLVLLPSAVGRRGKQPKHGAALDGNFGQVMGLVTWPWVVGSWWGLCLAIGSWGVLMFWRRGTTTQTRCRP